VRHEQHWFGSPREDPIGNHQKKKTKQNRPARLAPARASARSLSGVERPSLLARFAAHRASAEEGWFQRFRPKQLWPNFELVKKI
jgi:hypothetical protein